jgi:hypothetical protein
LSAQARPSISRDRDRIADLPSLGLAVPAVFLPLWKQVHRYDANVRSTSCPGAASRQIGSYPARIRKYRVLTDANKTEYSARQGPQRKQSSESEFFDRDPSTSKAEDVVRRDDVNPTATDPLIGNFSNLAGHPLI